MKKYVWLILFCMIACGCQSPTLRTKNQSRGKRFFSSSEPLKIEDIYGTYYQQEIIDVDEFDYVSQEEAYIPSLVYKIEATKFTFETDLKYGNVTYMEEELSAYDQRLIEGVQRKYGVYNKGKDIYVTIFIKDDDVYIANDSLKNPDHYTYVALMKQESEEKQTNQSSS